MSLILNALRVKNTENAESIPSAEVEGLVIGTGSSSSRPPMNWRIIGLIVGLLLTLGVTLGLQYWRSHLPNPHPEPVVLAPGPVTPAPVAVPPAAPDVDVNPDVIAARKAYEVGNYDQSMQLFQKVLADITTSAMLYNDLGMAALKKELYTNAEESFTKAITLDDHCAECFNNLGYLKTLTSQPTLAESYLQKAITIRPDYPDPYFNLAVVYEKNGDVGKAVKYYQEFIKHSPAGGSNPQLLAKIKEHIHELSGQ